MTDVANSMNSSTPTKAHMGQIIPDSPESVVLSPGVKEAMDRIFPLSASQLLQGGLSFGEDQLFNVPSVGATKESMQSKLPASHITTLATAGVSTPGSFDIASRNGTDFVNSSPVLTSDSHRLNCTPISNDNNRIIDNGSKILDMPMKAHHKSRISKADFEIVTSCDALINEYEKTARRAKYGDMSSSECPSKDDSDSEDMRRPFASIAKEKKRRKKRKKRADNNAEIMNSCLSEHNVNSEDEFKTSKSWKTNDKSVNNRDSDNCKIISQQGPVLSTQVIKQNTHLESLPPTIITKNTLGFIETPQDNNSRYNLDSQSSKDTFYKDSGIMTSEDISNISYSSAKENGQGEQRHSRQKLPKMKRQYFHVVKHINKIRSTFLPCFVVVQKFDNVHCYNGMKDINTANNVLPLSARVKYLSHLCDKGTLSCRKSKKTELVYKNIFEEIPLFDVSDDDFEKPRVRSLRKRDKHISYVEPSEDDILDEYSRKRSRGKSKDVWKSGDEISSENKKGKVQDLSNTVNSAAGSYVSSDHVTVLDRNRANTEKSQQITSNPNEIVVYPRAGVNSTLPYFPRTDGRDMFPPHIDEKSKHMYSQDNSKNITTYISVLSSGAMPGAFPSHPTPVSPYPTLPLGYPGGLAAQPFVGGGLPSCQLPVPSGAQNPCQFYVVRMNGKDVLLRFVPSGGPGVPSPSDLSKAKSIIVPPSPAHMFSPPVRQTHPIPVCRQTIMRQVSPVISASHGNEVSATPMPPPPPYGMPFLSRPAHQNCQDMSFPTLPMMPSGHLAGHVSGTSNRLMSVISPQIYTSHSPISAPSTSIFASTTLGSTSFRPVVSSTMSTQAIPDPPANVPAPNITTLIRGVRLPSSSLQAAAPNQSTSVRSVRIFVPGCTATGTPGRFATLGSLANNNSITQLSSSSSPLTHLSANSSLLPQYRSHDNDLTSDQRAAKRRKLEKKYPLPPGVIIKTEPLDAPSKPSTIITCKSLLPRDIQLMSSSIPGSSVQRFRIINPSTANALGMRNISNNSVYRTASVGGGQIVLVPTSLGAIPTTTTATSSTSSTTSLASAANIETLCSTSTSLQSSTLFQPYRNSPGSPQLFPPLSQTNTENNSTNSSAIHPATSRVSPFVDRPSSVGVPCESSVLMNQTHRPSLNISAESAIFSGSNDSAQLQQYKSPQATPSLDSVRSSLEQLQKLIQIQELRGLHGERLEKLKELLRRKEQHYNDLQKLNTHQTADGRNLSDSDEGRGIGNINEHGTSDTNPFVID